MKKLLKIKTKIFILIITTALCGAEPLEEAAPLSGKEELEKARKSEAAPGSYKTVSRTESKNSIKVETTYIKNLDDGTGLKRKEIEISSVKLEKGSLPQVPSRSTIITNKEGSWRVFGTKDAVKYPGPPAAVMRSLIEMQANGKMSQADKAKYTVEHILHNGKKSTRITKSDDPEHIRFKREMMQQLGAAEISGSNKKARKAAIAAEVARTSEYTEYIIDNETRFIMSTKQIGKGGVIRRESHLDKVEILADLPDDLFIIPPSCSRHYPRSTAKYLSICSDISKRQRKSETKPRNNKR